MARIGIFCLPMPSHMSIFLALAQTLSARGHTVTFFAISDNEERIRKAGHSFELLEPDVVPIGTLGNMMRQMSTLSRLSSMRLQGRFDELRYEAILAKGRGMIERSGMEALLVDQAEACSGSLAEATAVPWINVSCGLLPNSEPAVPPLLTSWSYTNKSWGIARNQLGYLALKIASSRVTRMINRRRREWRLKPFRRLDDIFSPFAQISQQVREFDFPRLDLPAWVHYVGPIRCEDRPAADFPWRQLTGHPLIYASLGTVVNSQPRLYRLIAEGCAGLDAQLVMSLGGADRAPGCDALPGSPLVVSYAPQLELIRRAALTITHAGLNSTLESLTEGVPLLALPITFEQPGIAARINWTGVGEFIRPAALTADRLHSVAKKVMTDPSYRQAALNMQTAILQSRGKEHAVDVIEQVLRTGRCVTAAAYSATQPSRLTSHVQ